MTSVEALELLKQGDKVMLKNDGVGKFYQYYCDDHIYQMTPTGKCCLKVIACYTSEQFLQTVSADFILAET